jgi:predicted CoA-binding protein
MKFFMEYRSINLHDKRFRPKASSASHLSPVKPAFSNRRIYLFNHCCDTVFLRGEGLVNGGNMKDEEIKDMLRNFNIVAVVGISPKEDRPSYVVASYLKSKGYRIIPVRPNGDEILGEKVYRSLSDIPKEIRVDVVDIFRKSEDVPPVVDEAIQRGAKVVWMQEGVIHKESGEKAEKARLKVIMDRCMKKEHQRLL